MTWDVSVCVDRWMTINLWKLTNLKDIFIMSMFWSISWMDVLFMRVNWMIVILINNVINSVVILINSVINSVMNSVVVLVNSFPFESWVNASSARDIANRFVGQVRIANTFIVH